MNTVQMPSLSRTPLQRRLQASLAQHRDRWLVGGAVLAGVLLRLLLLSGGRVVWGDEPSYLWLGRNAILGRGYSFTGHPDPHHSPLYPLVTGILYPLLHDMELASNIYYVVLGALLAVPIFLIGRRIYGRGVGLWAAALVTCMPALTGAVLFWGTMTEPLYYLLIYTGFWAALVAVEDDRLWGYAAAGACFALAYLARPEAVGYLAGMALFAGIVLLFERRLLRRRTLLALALYGLCFLALIFPYAVFVHSQTGSWQITEKAGVTFVTCLGLATHDVAAFDRATWGLDSTGREVFFFSTESYTVSMGDYIRAHPVEFARLVWGNIKEFMHYLISPRMFPALFVPVAALGLLATAWGWARLRRELFLWLTVLPLLGFVLFFIQERYIGAALPTFAIWLALGLRHLGGWCAATWDNVVHGGKARCGEETGSLPALGDSADAGERRLPGGTVARVLAVAPLLVVIAWFLAVQPQEMRETSLGSFRMGHKTVGLWLHDRVSRDAVVMSRYPAIAFYADTVWRPTPNADVPEMLAYARAKGVEYWVLDARETETMRPQYRPLLEGPLPPQIERLYVERSDGDPLVVFRFHW